MGVNSSFTDFLNNRKVAGASIALLVFAVLMIASAFTGRSGVDVRTQTNLLVRQIGHRLLLQSGDSSSQVLPVREVKQGTFVLEFENNFLFSHDSLMVLSRRSFPESLFPSGYTVSVHDCGERNIVYGYQINNSSPDILACEGRKQPRGCYTIEISFPDLKKAAVDYAFIAQLGGGMLLLFGVGLLMGRYGKSVTFQATHPVNTINNGAESALPALGKFLFDVPHQRLLLGDQLVTLTEKECRILELLNRNFGELIPRETLMQKIWIDEGVITGRSLDMFVSKLRKKLSGDPALRITNVHGKGYKLETITNP